jgi:Arc/MetJ-type ribon-helix-helix transcriptional regulator
MTITHFMPRPKKGDAKKVKIAISISPESLTWLDNGVASGEFASRSHGIEKLIKAAMREGKA